MDKGTVRIWMTWDCKGPVTQAPITRTIKMHDLDWLNKSGRTLGGAIQPIECVLFASLSLSFSLSLQCDLAFNPNRAKVTHQTVKLQIPILELP